MFSKFFIHRPIFATVMSIVIVIVGIVSLVRLPIELFPDITPPTVSVTANYPGANALDVAENVATPIEAEVNGVENMIYMLSKSTNDGNMTLDVTFTPGVDLNMSQVLVQNRVSVAQAKLPEEVKRLGVTTKKKSPTILLMVNLVSEKKIDPKTKKGILDPATGLPKYKYDLIYQSNYATLFIKDVLARIPGAGDVRVLGPREYSMRIWLDPDALAARKLTPSVVVDKLREANFQVPAGQIGQPPVKGVDFQNPLIVKGKLTTEEEFGNVIIKEGEPGQVVFLKNLVKEDAGIQLAAKNYDVNTYLDGQPSVAVAVYQLPGANALETAQAIRQTMKQLKETQFPTGLDYKIVYDTTVFIEQSIDEVYDTLIIAILLVFVVVLVFLQDWRTTIIPMVAVPVSLIGTFAVMSALGFSLNNLSLFGLILAIGIVVDDAIVVVENTERYLAQGFRPREAATKAMGEISGALVATTLVVCAVFVPTAFLAGISGAFYRQFALTIAGSTLISTFNALTLSPALCGVLLKAPTEESAKPEKKEALPRVGWILLMGFLAYYFFTDDVARLLGREADFRLRMIVTAGGAVFGGVLSRVINYVFALFFSGFNWGFDRSSSAYGLALSSLLRVAVIGMAVYFGLVALTYGAFQVVPKGFIPEQDKGYILVNAQLPDGASLERSDAVVKKMDYICRQMKDKDGNRVIKGVAHTIGVPGYSVLTGSVVSNMGGMFVVLEPFEKRKGNPELYATNIIAKLRKVFFKEIIGANCSVFNAPPVDGLGSTGGFKMQVQDRVNSGPAAIEAAVTDVIKAGKEKPEFLGLFSTYSAKQPQISIEVDRPLARIRKVSLSSIWSVMGDYFGSKYVNDFTLFGRNWQVLVQADPDFREKLYQLGKLKVVNADGNPVDLESFLIIRQVTGPALVNRYNMFYSAEVSGAQAPGVSSGQAISLMSELAQSELPNTMGFEWTELSFQELEAGKDPLSPLIFPLCVLLVFLTLAAQYESWSLPLAIILIVPMSMLFAMGGVWLNGMDNNIFTQIGLVVLIGLAAKNAILIVEFAKQKQDEGLGRYDAALEASKLRLRPILMTAFSFILGVIPLVIATGAGAEMRVALGIAVFSGMLGVTIFGIFLTPVFYLVVRWFTERKKAKALAPVTGATPSSPPAEEVEDRFTADEPADTKPDTGIRRPPSQGDGRPGDGDDS